MWYLNIGDCLINYNHMYIGRFSRLYNKSHWTKKKEKTIQNIYYIFPPSYIYLLFSVVYTVYISVCFISHMRLTIHVGQSVIIKLNLGLLY